MQAESHDCRRERVILMLLKAGPASRSALVLDTGWGIEKTRAVVDRLMDIGQVVPFPGWGHNQFSTGVLCLPETRAEVLRLRRMADSRKNTVRVHRARRLATA